MVVSVPTYGSPVTNSSGQTVGVAVYNPNTGQPLSGAGNFNPNTGQKISPTPQPATFNASTLSNSNQQLAVPTQTPPTSSNAFVNSVTGNYIQPQGSTVGANSQTGVNTGINTNIGNSNQNNWQDQFKSAYLGLTNELGSEGDVYNSLANQYQIPQINQQLAGIRGTIAQRTAAYTNQWQMANEEHAALPYIAGEQAQIQRTQAIEIGMLTAQEQALSGNLQAANDIVNQTIQHEFEPIKGQLAAMQSFYQMNQNDLSDSEKMQLQQNYNLQNTAVNALLQAKQSAATSLINAGLQYGVDVSQNLSAIGKAQTMQDVYSALGGISSAATGGIGNLGSNSGTSNIVNGYDMSTYATDPLYAQKLTATSTAIGQVNNAQQVSDVISKLAPNSPITSDMIASACATYGVDANTLMSVLCLESRFGTQGAGAKTKNPGNVGNTDSGATVTYANWQAGVNATAQQLARRQVSPSQVVSNSTSSQRQQAVTNSAPLFVRPALGFLDDGTPYINTGLLTDTASKTQAQIFASKNNIQMLNQQDVDAVRKLQTAQANLQDRAQDFYGLASNFSMSDTLGAPAGNFFGKLDFMIGAPFSKLFDTSYGSNLKAYNSNRADLIEQINALSGSTPRLNDNELRLAINNLPKLDEFSPDTVRDGEAKLQKVNQDFTNTIRQFIPGYTPTYDVSYQGYSKLISGNQQQPTQVQAPTQTAAPKTGDSQSYMGATYKFDGTQWVKQ